MKCPNCGAEMVRTPDKILTSKPPMYELNCPNCGVIKYEFVHNIHTPGFENEPGKIMYLPDPWQEFRCKSAKDILCALLTNHESYTGDSCNEVFVKQAIGLADELVKQLKQGK